MISKTWKWIYGTMSLATILGMGIAYKLMIIHESVTSEGASDSACNVNATISCDAVASSGYSEFFGVSVSLWSLAGYGFLLSLILWSAWRRYRTSKPWGEGMILSFTSLYALASLSLIYVMWAILTKWCLYCLAVDAVNFTLLGLSIWALLFKARESQSTGFQLWLDDWKTLKRNPKHLGLWVGLGLGFLSLAVLIDRIVIGEPPPLTLENLHQGAQKDAKGFKHHWIGSAQAPLVVEEFSDYQCPHCRKAHKALRIKMAERPGRVKLIHRHFPLDQACNRAVTRPFHRYACQWSITVECAGEQGKFWEANDYIFDHPEQTGRGEIAPKDLASKLKLDLKAFDKCMNNPKILDKIKEDIEEGIRLGIHGTPTFIINGEMGDSPLNPKYWGDHFKVKKRETLESLSIGDEIPLPNGRIALGDPDASLEIEAFFDYQCAKCVPEAIALRKKIKASGEKVRLIRRFMPMDGHCHPMVKRKNRSCELSSWVYCAGKEKKFWKANDYLLDHLVEVLGQNQSIEVLNQALDLDDQAMKKCMEDPETLKVMREEAKYSARYGFFEGMPLMINGELADWTMLSWFLNGKGVAIHGILKALGRSGLNQGLSKDGRAWLGHEKGEEVHLYLSMLSPASRIQYVETRRAMLRNPQKYRLTVHFLTPDRRCIMGLSRGSLSLGNDCDLAVMALCAAEEGKFWEVQDWILDHITEIMGQNVDLGLAMESLGVQNLKTCVQDPNSRARVHLAEDLQQGSAQLKYVPAFIYHQKVYDHLPQ